jgi:hypothetical protein
MALDAKSVVGCCVNREKSLRGFHALEPLHLAFQSNEMDVNPETAPKMKAGAIACETTCAICDTGGVSTIVAHRAIQSHRSQLEKLTFQRFFYPHRRQLASQPGNVANRDREPP